MKIVLLVEGDTEVRVLPSWFGRWLKDQACEGVSIQTVKLGGAGNFKNKASNLADKLLRKSDVLGVIGLVDLAGAPFPLDPRKTLDERVKQARTELNNLVQLDRFFAFCAVHELEAWLLSDPNIFPGAMRGDIRPLKSPEEVNGEKTPSARLDEIYRKHLREKYSKVTHGFNLFAKLDPAVAAEKCPYLKELLYKLLGIARRPHAA